MPVTRNPNWPKSVIKKILMPDVQISSPAELAAKQALEEMSECIRSGQSFRLEAGAGAGKTYSLIEALKLITKERGAILQRNRQQVACITYTNVATDEIIARTDAHRAIHASTIHSFCWQLIRGFQAALRGYLGQIPEWQERLGESSGVGNRTIEYELGHRHVGDDQVLLHHDDVLTLAVKMMQTAKFRHILTTRFPILFIDEYQDTNEEFAAAIVEHFIAPQVGPLIGLFGDSWQKIYKNVSGLIEHPNLRQIKKGANFRSVKEIVSTLNRIRSDLPQEVKDPYATGTVGVYHSNDWTGVRRKGNHWKGDLPAQAAKAYLEATRAHLVSVGWDFSPEKTKILMLTHRVLAAEQEYSDIVNTFSYSDAFLKKEDAHIAYLVDTVEPMCIAYANKRYGEMFSVMGSRSVSIRNLEDKRAWVSSMSTLLALRESGTVGDVLDFLKESNRPRLQDSVKERESRLSTASEEEIEESLTLRQIRRLREIPYAQIVSLALFVNDHTPFSTKHGVKGAEFDNVLVVFGRGWNQYDWNQFIEWFPDRYPGDKAEAYERNRNLFYVVCSRPRKNLALLFTQLLSSSALSTLERWFGKENVHSHSVP